MDNLTTSCLAASLLAAASIVHAQVPQSAAAPSPTSVNLPAAQAVQNGRVYRDVRYGNDSQRGNLLDLYLPANVKSSTPLIVYIHGGGWIGGDKRSFQASELLQLGYAVASINYRLTDEATFPAQIFDCKGAIRFLRANAEAFNIDPDRIGAWGDSAGGHLAALLGTTADNKELEGNVGGNEGISSRVQAVLDWFGPSDLISIVDQLDPKKLPREFSQEPTLLTRLLGGTIDDKADLARAASPLTYVGEGDAPFLILHGDQDALVPLQQSQLLHAALKEKGVESQLIVVRGAGHGGGAFLSMPNIMAMANFFATHLGDPRP